MAILAAGSSSRLGRPKQLVPYRGRPLLRHLALEALASRAARVMVVLGGGAEEISRALEGLDLMHIRNPEWTEGMGSSVRLCARLAQEAHPPLAGLLYLTCDQPAVTAGHVDRMIETAIRSPGRIVASRYADTLGVPALFRREHYPRLARISGDQGAKKLILEQIEATIAVPLAGGEMDVDTRRDLDKLKPERPADSPGKEDPR